MEMPLWLWRSPGCGCLSGCGCPLVVEAGQLPIPKPGPETNVTATISQRWQPLSTLQFA